MSETSERVRLVDKRFRVLLIALIVNGIAAFSKIIIGTTTGILMIAADGVHSLGDILSNIVCMVSLRYARRDADAKYPYGYAKFETIAAFGGCFLLLVGVFEITERLYYRIAHTDVIEFKWWIVGVMAMLMMMSSWVVWYETKRGKKLLGDSLIVDAAETRNDVLFMAGVLVGLFAIKFGYRWADPLFTAMITVIILISFWKNLKRTFHVLADASVVPELEIMRIAESVPGVQFCHAARSRGRPDAVFIDVHIGVLPRITVEEAHDVISHRVKLELQDHFKNVQCVTIHIEPDNEAARTRSQSVFKEGDY